MYLLSTSFSRFFPLRGRREPQNSAKEKFRQIIGIFGFWQKIWWGGHPPPFLLKIISRKEGRGRGGGRFPSTEKISWVVFCGFPTAKLKFLEHISFVLGLLAARIYEIQKSTRSFRAIRFTVGSLILFWPSQFHYFVFWQFSHQWAHCHANDVVVHRISIEEAFLFFFIRNTPRKVKQVVLGNFPLLLWRIRFPLLILYEA